MKFGHVPAAHQQPAAGRGVPDKLRDPADRLSLDLRGDRGEVPAADVGIDGRGEQIRERADGRRRRRDVPHEAGVPVEERMFKQEL